MFYGVTRYSLFSPGSPSWKTSRSGVFKTQEQYKDYLFSEQRLQMRADVFFGKSVPALAAMAENFERRLLARCGADDLEHVPRIARRLNVGGHGRRRGRADPPNPDTPPLAGR